MVRIRDRIGAPFIEETGALITLCPVNGTAFGSVVAGLSVFEQHVGAGAGFGVAITTMFWLAM